MTTPKLEVAYFDFNGGRGEPIRLALHIAGIPFEDRRLTGPEFGALKASGGLPFGQLPTLRINDGEQIPQSLAILRYVGRLGGLYPTDPTEALYVDAILDSLEGLGTKIFAPITDPEAKKAHRESLAANDIPRLISYLEASLKRSNSGYLVGSSLTIADLMAFNSLSSLRSGNIDHVPTTIVDSHPAALEHFERIAANPKVKEWKDAHKK